MLEQRGESWKREYLSLLAGDNEVPAAAATRYRHPEIKTAVLRDSRGKCAYCESKPRAVSPGDVEHVAPKARVPERIVDWANLLFSCTICNRRKGDYWSAEMPLIDPYEDTPEEHLQFEGPMVVDQSERGELTMTRLGLNRADLLERRAERLEALRRLLRRWMALSPGAMRDELLRLVEEEAGSDREYAAAAREFVRRERARLEAMAA